MTTNEIKVLLGNFLINAGRKVQASRVPTYKIIVNAAKCKKCGDIIESKHRHDFQTCDCGAISVDGGHDYCKRSGEPENLIELTKYKEVK